MTCLTATTVLSAGAVGRVTVTAPDVVSTGTKSCAAAAYADVLTAVGASGRALAARSETRPVTWPSAIFGTSAAASARNVPAPGPPDVGPASTAFAATPEATSGSEARRGT